MFKCTYCGRFYSVKSSLVRHQKTSKTCVPTFICDLDFHSDISDIKMNVNQGDNFLESVCQGDKVYSTASTVSDCIVDPMTVTVSSVSTASVTVNSSEYYIPLTTAVTTQENRNCIPIISGLEIVSKEESTGQKRSLPQFDTVSDSEDNELPEPNKRKCSNTDIMEINLQRLEKKVDALQNEILRTQKLLSEEISASTSSIQEYQKQLTAYLQKEIKTNITDKKKSLNNVLHTVTELNKTVLELLS